MTIRWCLDNPYSTNAWLTVIPSLKVQDLNKVMRMNLMKQKEENATLEKLKKDYGPKLLRLIVKQQQLCKVIAHYIVEKNYFKLTASELEGKAKEIEVEHNTTLEKARECETMLFEERSSVRAVRDELQWLKTNLT